MRFAASAAAASAQWRIRGIAISDRPLVLVAGGTLTSLLTLYVVARVWTKAFWRSRADAPEGHLAGAAPAVLLDDIEDVEFADDVDVSRASDRADLFGDPTA